MARIAGIELPKDKRLEIALTYIYGIGRVLANEILARTQIDPNIKVKNLSETEISKLSSYIAESYKVEGDLRREVQGDIKRLIEIGSYRGMRHRRNLPCRGQRTRTNARTKRGKRKTIGAVKAAKKVIAETAKKE
ncbi:MAG TPA: 30S ribosomal protein S13 [Elusimicrobia bacterium]|jgi:small subunit ribosomal protein S13|nr:30S ribosomal protein S13 [Elusimicrobiota bacterium]